jgi:hypothetical protein
MDKRTHESWAKMKQRCLNSNNHRYALYGGRGITVCDEWLTYSGFVTDMGVRPEGMTLDRIDTNGNYCKENCRWATQQTQVRNQRQTVFTEERVKYLRAMWESRKPGTAMRVFARIVAPTFNCGPDAIRSILQGRNWK